MSEGLLDKEIYQPPFGMVDVQHEFPLPLGERDRVRG